MPIDKFHYYDGLYFEKFIEPRFSEIRDAILREVTPGSRVVDIGCGAGALALELAQKGVQVTGVDLSARMIAHAERRRQAAGEGKVRFVHGDAAQLKEQEPYDYAVISMALHEMNPELRLQVVRKAKELAHKVILADYTAPLPTSLAGFRVRLGEFFSGIDHFKGFMDYQENQGLDFILKEAALSVEKEVVNPRGTLRVVVAN